MEENMNSMNMPEKIETKKRVYLHFAASVYFCLSPLNFFNFGLDSNWYIYAMITWFFVFILLKYS
jgi:hypothetical protein